MVNLIRKFIVVGLLLGISSMVLVVMLSVGGVEWDMIDINGV